VSDAVAPESFEDFSARTWREMVRLARAHVDDREDAVEAVQDAFSRVYPKFGRIGRDSTDAYLRATVLNGCRRHLKRRQLARTDAALLIRPVELAADHTLDAVRRLARDRRDVVVLRYYLDLSEAEIAATLGIPQGTVKSRLHRALRELEAVLR
jgi:RNA polymerase sigma factor (sigma-70 family)